MADETTKEATPQETPQAQGEGKQVGTDELVNAMRYMFSEMQTLKGNIEGMQAQAQAPNQQAPAPQPTHEAAPSPVSNEQVDVEMLDNKGLASYVENRVQEQLRPLAEGIQNLNNTTVRTEVEEQVNKLRSDETAHFDSFVNEVKDIMEKKGGSISVEEALVLAKAQDPDKVGRLNEQQKKDAPDGGSDPFVGLLPTSGKSSRSDRMEGKEAASAAWEELGLDDFVKEMPN